MRTPEVTAVSDRDFAAVQQFVYRELGVSLSDAKRALVASRLGGRVRALRLSSYRDYVARAEADREERQRLIDAITTNETRFFREHAQFEFLRSHVFPGWKRAAEGSLRSRTTRIWSAGCSSGEEPYSIAMLLLDLLPLHEGWTHDLLATDVSEKALGRATEAVYPASRKDDIPTELLKKYVLRGIGARDGQIAMMPQLTSAVRFSRLNLNEAASYPPGTFDAIFCRNVLIYFDTESRSRVIDGLLSRLDPGGMLFLGHAESLSGRHDVRSVIPNVYVKGG